MFVLFFEIGFFGFDYGFDEFVFGVGVDCFFVFFENDDDLVLVFV